MWTYEQFTGRTLRDGKCLWTGYSGHGAGKNNPGLQDRKSQGPIPRGRWRIVSLSAPDDLAHGGYYLRLQPEPGTETFGRSGFLIHGDSRSAPGSASLGCIILPRSARQAIWESGVRELEVVRG